MSSSRLFRFPKPEWLNGPNTRTAGVYIAGALFALGFFFFIDASTYSHSSKNGSDIHIKFVDWIPGICSALGMLVINSIEKTRLSADSYSYSGTGVAWKARLVLFLGFALMAGGLAGSVAVLVLKYVVPEYQLPTLYFGIANVVTNGLIMLSSVVLWVSQNMDDDYTIPARNLDRALRFPELLQLQSELLIEIDSLCFPWMHVRYATGVLRPSRGYICPSCRLQSAVTPLTRGRRYKHSDSPHPTDNGDVSNGPATFRDRIQAFLSRKAIPNDSENGASIRDTGTRLPNLSSKRGKESTSLQETQLRSHDSMQEEPREKVLAERLEDGLSLQERQPSDPEAGKSNNSEGIPENDSGSIEAFLKDAIKDWSLDDSLKPKNGAMRKVSLSDIRARKLRKRLKSIKKIARKEGNMRTNDIMNRLKVEKSRIEKKGKDIMENAQAENPVTGIDVASKSVSNGVENNEEQTAPEAAEPVNEENPDVNFSKETDGMEKIISRAKISKLESKKAKNDDTKGKASSSSVPRGIEATARSLDKSPELQQKTQAKTKKRSLEEESPKKNSNENSAKEKSSKEKSVEKKTREAKRKEELAIRLEARVKMLQEKLKKAAENSPPKVRKIRKNFEEGPRIKTFVTDGKKKSISQLPGSKSLASALDLKGKKAGATIHTADAAELSILPVDVEQPPVPTLSYELERVLFNPGVYQLQDPRSRVYNFDPYLQKIMPVADFDFNALKEYITSSRDKPLKAIAKKHGKRYVGSTSSMTGVLAHFHFLLSQWRPINTSMLSKEFPADLKSFTELQRTPSAIFLRWKDGSYAIDADKEFATANVLSMLGKSMEKLLTLSKDDFEKYRKSSPSQITEEESSAPESYHYSTMGDFLMRSQLDAYDPRLPGTGMFDLKTRAVVSIRMDVSNYEKGVGYQIKARHGAWESYEREYYDLIRAAFLKYSMQVRMGRMDGIFVAFHNIERIFGFQYISLPEMDSTIHGQWDTSVGDQEFTLSLDLLNKILNKSTQKYPETSLRIHFETRDAASPFMYIFAEPVTEEQVTEIQSQNDAKIQEFENKILGIGRGEDSQSQDPQEEDRRWADIQASVQEAMDKDELSVDKNAEDEEAQIEKLDEGDADPGQGRLLEQGPLYTKKSQVEANDDVSAAAAGDEDEDVEEEDEEEDDDLEEDGDFVEESDEDEAENERAKETEEGNRNDQEDDLENKVEDDGSDEVEETHETEGDTKEASIDGEITEGDHSVTAANEQLVESENAVVAETLTPEDVKGDVSDVSVTEEQASSTTEGPESENSDLESSATEEGTSTSLEEEHISSQGDDEEFRTDADRPFLESISQEHQPDSESDDILAMTLTLRNKVNGHYVLRPENLSGEDKWSIEYSLSEVPTQSRAKALYEACQVRRKKKLDTPMAPGDQEVISGYARKLREMSSKGREWRDEMDERDAEKPVHVLGSDIAKNDGDTTLAERELKD